MAAGLAEKQAEFEANHRAKGWFTDVYTDEPGEVTPDHRHGPAELLILEGTVELTLDKANRTTLQPGDEVHVADNQLHGVIAGPEGFRYVFACPMEEAIKQQLVDD